MAPLSAGDRALVGEIVREVVQTASAGDRALVGEIVRKVVQTAEMLALLRDVFEAAARDVMGKAVAAHLAACPTRIRVDRARCYFLGAAVLGGLLGFGATAGPWVVKILFAM